MRLAPARFATTLAGRPSSRLVTSLAVVVLPLVPVIRTVPPVRSRTSLRRTLGSTARATSPGKVVPPPCRVSRESAPVAFPASTAAVRLTGSASPVADWAGDRRPAVEGFHRPFAILPGLAGSVERRAAAGHTPAVAQPPRERFEPRFDGQRWPHQVIHSLSPDLVPLPVDGGRGDLEAGPGDGEPPGRGCNRRQPLASAASIHGPAVEREGDVGADLRRHRVEVDLVEAVEAAQDPDRGRRVGAPAAEGRADRDALYQPEA